MPYFEALLPSEMAHTVCRKCFSLNKSTSNLSLCLQIFSWQSRNTKFTGNKKRNWNTNKKSVHLKVHKAQYVILIQFGKILEHFNKVNKRAIDSQYCPREGDIHLSSLNTFIQELREISGKNHWKKKTNEINENYSDIKDRTITKKCFVISKEVIQ